MSDRATVPDVGAHGDGCVQSVGRDVRCHPESPRGSVSDVRVIDYALKSTLYSLSECEDGYYVLGYADPPFSEPPSCASEADGERGQKCS